MGEADRPDAVGDTAQSGRKPGAIRKVLESLQLGKSVKLILASLVLGVAGNWIYGQAFGKAARLTVDTRQSSSAGQTTIDVLIENAGDYDLAGLDATFAFDHPATFAIAPPQLAASANMAGNSFTLAAPLSFKLAPSSRVELRFVSNGSNAISDVVSLPTKVYTTWTHSERVLANLRSQFQFSWVGATLGIAFITIVILAVVLVLVIRNQPR